MIKDSHFYLANLCVDIDRCIAALQVRDFGRYKASLVLAEKTFQYIEDENTKSKALAILCELQNAKKGNQLEALRKNINDLAGTFAAQITV